MRISLPLHSLLALLLCSSAVQAAQAATPPPLDAFFTGARLQGASLSPDGSKLALSVTQDGNYGVVIQDRSSGQPPKQVAVFKGEDGFVLRWCNWANDKRVLCSLRGQVLEGAIYVPITRLIGVNADGTDLKVLGNSNRRGGVADFNQDRIVDWTPDDPDTVLMAVDEGSNGEGGRSSNGGYPDGYPDIYAVNVYTGSRKLVMQEYPPLSSFLTDGRGNVRLGVGLRKDVQIIMVRLEGETQWRELARLKAFEKTKQLVPVAIIPGTNSAYATGIHEGREALWKIDLTDKTDAQLVFSHDRVDVTTPLFASDQRLLGVTYEAEKEEYYFFDKEVAAIQQSLSKGMPGRVVSIIDSSKDEKVLLIRTNSDVEAPMFYTLERSAGGGKLSRIGSYAPGLANHTLAAQTPVSFTSRDGKQVPGYLTMPVPAADGAKPPLIVMPHGGPHARDSWGFDPWLQFLASKGYAVLQVQFRGSTGYGEEWYEAGFRDWGGLPYNDVIDGTQWVLAQGKVDASRVCMVGASFGGYMTLLSATRNQDKLFKCAISIAGVSDLSELKTETTFTNGGTAAKSIGLDAKKLREASPRVHAAKVNLPLMLIHGDRDITVMPDQSKAMVSALKSANIPHEVLYIKGADHYFMADPQRRQWFTAMGDFLQKHIGR